MSYVPNIMRAVDFMERNLDSPISVSDVASEAAYSTFHFVRLFKTLTGETPGGYLRRRRLTEAARDLALSRRRIIEIALDYQFQSQEAFTRAFRDSFGIAPGAFRKKGAAHLLNAAQRISELHLIHCMEAITMEPKIVRKEAVQLIGIVYYGDNRNWEIPRMWEQFLPMTGTIPNRAPAREYYGVCFYTENFSKDGLFYYLAALPVSSLEEIPIALVGKALPASEYAVFTHRGPLVGAAGTVRDTYAYAYGTWLPNSPYANPYAYDFEYYDDRYTANDDPDCVIDICIPIREK